MVHLQTPALRTVPPPLPAVAVVIQDGVRGTEQTLAAMRSLIFDGKKDPSVHALAGSILRKARVPAFDFAGEARAIYESVRRNVRFTRDVRGMETLHTAPETISRKMGDCDDMTVLLCSLLETVGLRTQIVTVGTDPQDPETFTHVYPEVFLNHRWVPVDAARRHPAFGRGVTRWCRKREWATDSGEWQDMAGLGDYVPGPVPQNMKRAPRRLASGRFVMGEYPTMGFRPNPRAPHGQGRYGARALSGVGDTSTSDQLLQELPQLTVGVSDIITASRANPLNLYPTTNPVGSNVPAPNALSAGLGNYLPLLLLGGLAIGAVVLLRNR